MSFSGNENYNKYYGFPSFAYMDMYRNKDLMQLGGCRCKKSYFRVLNGYGDKPIDVQVNEILMAENLSIGGLTRYVQFSPGTYRVKIYESEGDKELVFETNIDIDRNLAYTAVIAKDDENKDDISILVVPEEKENAIKGKMSSLRLTNIAMNAPDMDVVTSDGTVLFSGINYANASGNIAVPSGHYNLYLRDSRNKNNLLKIPNVDFAPRMHYTMFIAEKNDELQLMIPENGVNYLDIC